MEKTLYDTKLLRQCDRQDQHTVSPPDQTTRRFWCLRKMYQPADHKLAAVNARSKQQVVRQQKKVKMPIKPEANVIIYNKLRSLKKTIYFKSGLTACWS